MRENVATFGKKTKKCHLPEKTLSLLKYWILQGHLYVEKSTLIIYNSGKV